MRLRESDFEPAGDDRSWHEWLRHEEEMDRRAERIAARAEQRIRDQEERS